MVKRTVFILSAVATVLSVIIGIKLKNRKHYAKADLPLYWD